MWLVSLDVSSVLRKHCHVTSVSLKNALMFKNYRICVLVTQPQGFPHDDMLMRFLLCTQTHVCLSTFYFSNLCLCMWWPDALCAMEIFVTRYHAIAMHWQWFIPGIFLVRAGVFLLPYCFFAVLCGVPLFLLETVVGQYTQEGAITCWTKLCPLAMGNLKVDC